jgi:hypothetical protein
MIEVIVMAVLLLLGMASGVLWYVNRDWEEDQ